jgi:adenosylhomocysteine nucleosidase
MINKVIGIICAMDIELKGIKEFLTSIQEIKNMNYTFYQGEYANNTIICTKCGIGKVNAGIVTTLLIEHFHPDLIFNSGIAGGYDRKLRTLDAVIAQGAVYGDVDMSAYAAGSFPYGMLEGFPREFRLDNEILKSLQKISFPFTTYFGTICTTDTFVTDYEKTKKMIDEHFSDLNIMACDMESCAIAQACYLQNVKFIIVRTISDCIGNNNAIDYLKFSQTAALNASSMLKLIIEKM